jgi:hypothetical protein
VQAPLFDHKAASALLLCAASVRSSVAADICMALHDMSFDLAADIVNIPLRVMAENGDAEDALDFLDYIEVSACRTI